MFGINPRTHRRSKVADDRFCDAVHADRIDVAKSAMQNSNRAPQKQSRYRIAPADSEINGDQQRKIDQLGPTPVFMQEGLKNESEQSGADDRAAVKFVNLDICFRMVRPDVEHVGHFISEGRAISPPWRQPALEQRPV